MRIKIKILLSIIALSLLTLSYQNCGGSFSSISQSNNVDNNSSVTNWVVSPAPTLTAGSADTYDLKATLPSGIKPNGVFGVDTSGPSLPSGMALDANTGIIAVNSASAGTTNGVVFTYTEPN